MAKHEIAECVATVTTRVSLGRLPVRQTLFSASIENLNIQKHKSAIDKE